MLRLSLLHAKAGLILLQPCAHQGYDRHSHEQGGTLRAAAWAFFVSSCTALSCASSPVSSSGGYSAHRDALIDCMVTLGRWRGCWHAQDACTLQLYDRASRDKRKRSKSIVIQRC